ncbi:MAG: toprim domain-containing protein, partial [Planctomycetota bacterium]
MGNGNFAAVRERVDIAVLVADLTEAKVKSRSPTDVRLVPCPFCGSKTGFSVNPQTKTYCCHHAGCGAQGDVFTFVKAVRGFTRNYDALKFLAELVGYELPKTKALGDDNVAAILALTREMKQAAVDYYAERLWACRDKAFSYTRDGVEHTTTVLRHQTDTRGHSEDILKRVRVGWADGKLLAHLKERYRDHPDRKLAFAAMLASGLVKRTDSGFHDLFRPGGYVYPVTCEGRVITLTAKYPDDSISNYQLPRTVEMDGQDVSVWDAPFYFLNQDALGTDDLVLVEGEDDLLTVMDLGRHAAVCGLRGTPSREQLAALAERRRGKRTFLCFDSDEAGRELTWRVANTLAIPDFDVRVIGVPAGHKDIDDALRAAGRDRAGPDFASLLDTAPPAIDHLLDSLARDLPEANRNELAERFARLAAKQPPLTQERLQKRMRQALGASARTVERMLSAARKRPKPPATRVRPVGDRPSPESAESHNLYFRWSAEGLERIELLEVEGRQVEKATPVSNFIIRIVRNIEVIDDLRGGGEFDCRLLMKDMPQDAPGRPFRIDSRHYGSNARLAEDLFGAGNCDLSCMTKDMDFIRMASNAFSKGKVVRLKTVRYVGYAKTPGSKSLGYVTPSVVIRDGRIIPAAEAESEFGFRCELPPGSFKSVSHLDLAIVSDDEFRDACGQIKNDLLRFKGPEIGRACLGHAFLAPVISRLDGFKPYALALVGPTGVGKTTLAAYFQSF